MRVAKVKSTPIVGRREPAVVEDVIRSGRWGLADTIRAVDLILIFFTLLVYYKLKCLLKSDTLLPMI